MTSELVIKHYPPSVWTFSKPFLRGGFIPLGGRSTAFKLQDGSLFVCASHPLWDQTRAKIQEIADSQVSYVAAFNAVHHLFIGDYAKEYPSAKVIGVRPLVRKRPDIQFDGVYGRDEDPLNGLTEVKAEYFNGFINKDIAFFHVPSKTVAVADLLFNLPAYEQFSQAKESATQGPVGFLAKYFNPNSRLLKSFLWYVGAKDRPSMTKSAKIVASWEFDKLVPCHGDTIDGIGKAAWRNAYSWFLDVNQSDKGK